MPLHCRVSGSSSMLWIGWRKTYTAPFTAAALQTTGLLQCIVLPMGGPIGGERGVGGGGLMCEGVNTNAWGGRGSSDGEGLGHQYTTHGSKPPIGTTKIGQVLYHHECHLLSIPHHAGYSHAISARSTCHTVSACLTCPAAPQRQAAACVPSQQ